METLTLPFDVPQNVRRLVELCLADLWSGPLYNPRRVGASSIFRTPADGKPWPEFCGATAALRAWVDKHDIARTYYYDADSGCFSDREPEYEEDSGCEWWQVSGLALLVGVEPTESPNEAERQLIEHLR